jgi:hypothetical protein
MRLVSKNHTAMRTALTLGVAAILASACPCALLAQAAQSKTGTRQPLTNCQPVKSQPSNAAQIARMIQCAREGERTGTITILTNIAVQLGATRKYVEFTDNGNYGIDPAAPVLPLRGSLDRYVCNPITHKRPGDVYGIDNEGKNCMVVHERKASGSCIRTSFGDWTCSMIELVHPDEWVSNQPPPR